MLNLIWHNNKKNMKPLYILLILSLLSFGVVNAQVGIGTTNPKTTLHVEGNPTNTTTADGVRAPVLSLGQLDAKIAAYGTDQDGVIIYINDVSAGSTETETANITETGYYHYNASNDVWKAMGATGPQGAMGTPGNDGEDGQDGVGITSTIDNGNGTFTLNFSNGSSFTTPDLTGPQGSDGEGITTLEGLDLFGNPGFTGPGNPGTNPVQMFDAQSNSIMPYYNNQGGPINTLFSANLDTTGQFKLGIHESAFSIGFSGYQAGAPTLYDSNFSPIVFTGDFFLPAPDPGDMGLPYPISKFKFLTIKDSSGQVWLIPAYGY
ncbi:hypothetical protein GCM10010832_26520 [Psychroflexus planctonicus]|uniref:Collagen triple helix repeat-containing protein n=2 Tax=Psychroflexus planctonicus TaxID=1526575 RepID=A0ABQ1SPV5_9FLAO|nr:hypothetical protein GCM10010832_26520 [Psychroflexus planctonicus]